MIKYPKYYIQGLKDMSFDTEYDATVVALFLGMNANGLHIKGYKKTITVQNSEWDYKVIRTVTYDDVNCWQWGEEDSDIFTKYEELYDLPVREE